MSSQLQAGKLIKLRGRDWIVLPSDNPDLLRVKPLGGSEEEVTGIYLPFALSSEQPEDASFAPPTEDDLGNITTARALYDAARLAFRNGAGPFRALAKLSFRPRAYQMVPLIMALRQESTRLLIADDVGVGKTVEALLIVREKLERGEIRRFAVLCPPHLCEQWCAEIESKLDINAVIIRSSTQAQLDRQIHGDTSVYQYYPFQVISIDYIKSDVRRNVFIKECPELLIVDEAHTCTRPAGASRTQQQRYDLIRHIADKKYQQLLLLTATPHSGKPEEFQALLGLLNTDFEALQLDKIDQTERKALARHFIQRKRADVEKWMEEDTPFPERDAAEQPYELSPGYTAFFDDMLDFAREMVVSDNNQDGIRRAHHWTALNLLRGVMSSPRAGVTMLQRRHDKVSDTLSEEAASPGDDLFNLTHGDMGDENDTMPLQVMKQTHWSDKQRRQLKELETRLAEQASFEKDGKLAMTARIVEEWLIERINPVIFCHYIETANYVGEMLKPRLTKKYKNLDLAIITSDLPDELRKERIQKMSTAPHRVLVATDCLSEGINLQESFTGVIHYDLHWNPNRLEQREGRVDRFGQSAPLVKTRLLFGKNNPVEGTILDVLFSKVKEIKKQTGCSVSFPDDSMSIIDTITQSVLLSPHRRNRYMNLQQAELPFEEMDDTDGMETRLTRRIEEATTDLTRRLEEAAGREKVSRAIFAQNAIKAQSIETDLKQMDEAIGDPTAVKDFVVSTLRDILGFHIREDGKGYRIDTTYLDPALRESLPAGNPVKVSFLSPTPEGYYYLGRNHAFVEQLCHLIMAHSLDSRNGEKKAARAAVIRTDQVSIKTTLCLFRCRNVIKQRKNNHQIVAEEMILWGWCGTPQQKEYLNHHEAKELLNQARATSNMSSQACAAFLNNELKLLEAMNEEQDKLAEAQAQNLVAAHERFSALQGDARYQVVYPVLPMDLLGLYILLPDGNREDLS
jgi:superfamily II DNA or RNA helicase